MNQSNVIDAGLEVSRGISELGVLVVIAGIFIVVCVMFLLITFNRYNQHLKTQDKRFQELLTKATSNRGSEEVVDQTRRLITALESLMIPLTALLAATTETMKEEVTYNQANRILKIEIVAVKYTLIEAIKNVIKRNHIHQDPDATKYKIKRICNNTYTSFMGGLSLYKYKSIRLPDYQGENWCSQITDLLINFTFSDQQDYDKLDSDIDLIMMESKSEFESNINSPSE